MVYGPGYQLTQCEVSFLVPPRRQHVLRLGMFNKGRKILNAEARNDGGVGGGDEAHNLTQVTTLLKFSEPAVAFDEQLIDRVAFFNGTEEKVWWSAIIRRDKIKTAVVGIFAAWHLLLRTSSGSVVFSELTVDSSRSVLSKNGPRRRVTIALVVLVIPDCAVLGTPHS
jgi:hypothetical protein